ncbi:hypothetical protein LEP1GSC172_3916 [Leptospira noguchii]|uniref:Uncharacterized protein n=1 Tax=Leptospira noguchii TaxID=28182 RepID=M6VIY7_9LEPT|nr:hypothetical protein LEP1GSC172_3916 [Leptospira noguchii]
MRTYKIVLKLTIDFTIDVEVLKIALNPELLSFLKGTLHSNF